MVESGVEREDGAETTAQQTKLFQKNVVQKHPICFWNVTKTDLVQLVQRQGGIRLHEGVTRNMLDIPREAGRLICSASASKAVVFPPT